MTSCCCSWCSGGAFVRRRMASVATLAIAALTALVITSAASGAVTKFSASPMNCPNENPCGSCTLGGVGHAAFNLDTVTGMVKYYLVYSGMGSPETGAHVHGNAGLCVNAGVIFPLPAGAVKFGSYGPLTAAQQGSMNGQLHYVNVHSQARTAGHLRAQIVPEAAVTGACCLQAGQFCIETTQAMCAVNFGGVYQGDGTVCSPPQACCLQVGGCVDVDPICCDDLNGIPLGPGSTCAAANNCVQHQACCFPDGTCQFLDLELCLTDGGRPQGLGSNCANTQCYKNWVIADDFMFGDACTDCPPDCDFNTDGDCNAADLNDVLNCVSNQVGPCDFTCDGQRDFLDYFVFDCTLSGGQNCCQFGVSPVNYVRWYGSYFDPTFEPGTPKQFRFIDGWSLALHRDIPPQPCPPPPAGTQPIDLCGTIVALPICPGVTGFRPDGSPNIYQLLGGGFPPIGSKARICGFIDPACVPCPPMIACITVQGVFPCDTGISRPSELVAQWIFPSFQVTETDTGQIGCDGHRIFEYTTFLQGGCLVHNFGEPGEVEYFEFRPRPGRTYWLSIQAEVGHAIDQQFPPPTFQPVCTYADNGNYANRDFWGWHTTPPGHHHKDDAYMGMTGMACDMIGWLYNWMNHLHWSDPLYNQCADDPTKSMDMAFYLSNFNKGGENVLWCQPVWPGPPVIPPPTFPQPPQLPPGGVDEFPQTNAQITVEIFNPPIGIHSVNLNGPTVVARKNPMLVGPNDVIDTEIISMTLTGNNAALGGPVNLSEPPGPAFRSLGGIQGPAGNPFPVDSFFDVFVRIDLPGVGVSMRTQTPVNMQLQPPGTMWEVPPGQAIYQSTNVVFLVDVLNPMIIYGRLLFAQHDTGTYRGGMDIHSDMDWTFMPVQDCPCRGDMSNDNRIDGDDIQGYVDCYIGCGAPGCFVPNCPCSCADMDADTILDGYDLNLFINKLLFDPNTMCP